VRSDAPIVSATLTTRAAVRFKLFDPADLEHAPAGVFATIEPRAPFVP
jgi:hypothetical protein